MKKIVTFLLIVVMCLSFVSCDEEKEAVVVGQWKCVSNDFTITINSDGTGIISTYSTEDCTWTYDEDSKLIIFVVGETGWTQMCVYNEKEDSFYGDGLTFKRVK